MKTANRGQAVFFTGPAAAGKSTVAEAWRSDGRAYAVDNSELSVEQVVALVEAEVLRRSARADP